MDPKDIIQFAIQNEADSVNPYAAEAARMLQDLECKVNDIPMRERAILEAAVQKLPLCLRQRSYPLKFSIKYTHTPSSTDYYISFWEGWYLAEIEHEDRRQLVVGSRDQGLFLQKLQIFVATLPECPEWAREQEQLRLKKKEPLLPFTKAETHAAFFVLSGWLQGSKETNGLVYDRSLQNVVCLPSISEMEFILKEAKRLGLEVLSDDQISEMVKQAKEQLRLKEQEDQAKWDVLSDADKAFLVAWAKK